MTATLFLVPIGIKASIDSEREQNATKQEQKEQDRVDALAKKYDVSHLSPESQKAFWRLVELTPFDLGDTDANYQDSIQTGEWLQQDVAVLNAEIVKDGGTTNEYDLAQELIPADTQGAMKAAGFELTPLDPVHCDVASLRSYRPFDYTNHMGREFKVRYKKDGATISIPLGARQTPVPSESYEPRLYYSLYFPANPALIGTPRDSKEYELSPDQFYKVAGCETLPSGPYTEEDTVKHVYSE